MGASATWQLHALDNTRRRNDYVRKEQQCRTSPATGKYCKPPSACAYNSCDCWRWSASGSLIEDWNANSQA